jgi:hypothetical protein
MCRGGDLMENPFRKVVFNFGVTKNTYPGIKLTLPKITHANKLNPFSPICTHRMTAGVTGSVGERTSLWVS